MSRTYPPTRVFMLGDQVAISWPYGEPDFYDKMARVKAVPGRKWNPDDKVWTLPANEAALSTLAEMAAVYADAPSRFEIDDDAVEALERIGAALAETVESSHALSSDYEATGIRPEMQLLEYQRAGVAFGISSKRYINADEPGCVSGDTIIKMQRAGITRTITVKDLYEKFNGVSGRWRADIQTNVRALVDGVFHQHRVVDVIQTGIRPCIRVQTQSGKSITLTEDHLILTPKNGWVEAGSLSVGDTVVTNGQAACKRCGSTDRVATYKYAKFPGYCQLCIKRYYRKNKIKTDGPVLDKDGYVLINSQYDHPRANKAYQVPEHILVMEAYIGRYVNYPEEHVHHIDEDKGNNDISNLQLIGAGDHQRIHDRYKHLDGGKTINGGTVVFIPKVEEIVSIESAETQMVYDLVMADPHRNFVANGIVVHNCGKTCQAVAVAADRAAWPILVTCPPKLELNWRKEIRMWVDPGEQPLRIQIASGTTRCRIEQGVDVLIVHHDIFYAWKKVISAVRWGCVIADEAHAYKGKSQRTQTMKDVIKAVDPEYVQFLTGTPVLSRPVELWNLIEMTGHASTFGSWKNFVVRYCNYKEKFIRGKNGKPGRWITDVSGASNTDELNRILRSSGIMIRRRKIDVLKDLPPKRWVTVPVEMSAGGVKAYDQADAAVAKFVAERRSRDAERELAWRIEAEQVWEHSVVEGKTHDEFIDECVAYERELYEYDETARLAENEELIRYEALKQIAFEAKRDAAYAWIDSFLESGQKLVVFAHHREVVLDVAAKYNAPTIIGGQNAQSVEDGKERFQTDPDCRVIACNIQAGGKGHTLTAASDVCFLELAWTPGDMDQCSDRCHRIGQKGSVTGWVLAASRSDGVETIDEEIADLLDRKRKTVDSTTDGEGEDAQVSILKELSERIGKGSR